MTSTNYHGSGADRSGGGLTTRPSLVEYKHMRFLIMDAPRANNLHLYLRECKLNNVTHLCRVCEETYPAEDVQSAGISMHEMEYDDGDAPPPDILNKWLDLVHQTFEEKKSGVDKACIAVHCVAGLGRAPVLVAISLIEHGMDPVQAVEFIRERRRGAINKRQLVYLESYQRVKKGTCNCIIA
jgi:protein tyrosine phosphatase type 4A